jgi:hypothetical protein
MRKALAVVVAAVVAIASCRKSYQVEATLIGDGTYAIRAQNSTGDEPGTAFDYAMQRGHDVCPRGFDVFGEDDAARQAWEKLRRAATFRDIAGGALRPTASCRASPRSVRGAQAPRGTLQVDLRYGRSGP